MEIEDLLNIERGFWFEGADYYNQHISNDAMFVFPGMVLGKEDGVNAADQAPRWNKLDITNEKLIYLSDNISILTYKAEGQRKGSNPYTSSITTIYRLESGEPRMVFHQHTPDTK